MVELGFLRRGIAWGDAIRLSALLLLAALALYPGVPEAAAEDGGQPGGQVEHLTVAYEGSEGVARLIASHPGSAQLEVANPVSDGETFSVRVGGGPVTTVTLDIGGSLFTLNTSCYLPVYPGLLFGPGTHHTIGAASDPSLEVVSMRLGTGQVAYGQCADATPVVSAAGAVVDVLGVQLPPSGDGSLAPATRSRSTAAWLGAGLVALLMGGGAVFIAASLRRERGSRWNG